MAWLSNNTHHIMWYIGEYSCPANSGFVKPALQQHYMEQQLNLVENRCYSFLPNAYSKSYIIN